MLRYIISVNPKNLLIAFIKQPWKFFFLNLIQMESQPQNGHTATTNNPIIITNPLEQNIPPKKISKMDFFILDRPSDPFKKLWCKSEKQFPKNLLEKPVILNSQFIKLGKKMHLINIRHYFVTEDHIYYKKVKIT